MKLTPHIAVRTFFNLLQLPNVRFLLAAAFVIIILATFLIAVSQIGTAYHYEVGDIADTDIRVTRDIEYVNEIETHNERKREAEAVPVVFDKDANVLQRKIALVNALFTHVADTLKQFPPVGNDYTFQLYAMKSRMPKYLHFNDAVLYEFLKYKDIQQVKKSTIRVLVYLYDDPSMGILNKPYENPLRINNNNATIRTINTPEPVDEVSRSLGSIKTADEIRPTIQAVTSSMTTDFPKHIQKAIADVVIGSIEPNLTFNIEETKRRIVEAVKKVPPQMSKLKKGMTIVREGDTITKDILEKIQIYNQQTMVFNISTIVGLFLIQVLFIFIFGYFLLEYNRYLLPDRKSAIIIFSLITAFMIYTFFISRIEAPINPKLSFALLLPVSFTTITISILYNRYLAIMAGIYIVFFASVIHGGNFTTIIIAFTSALMGVFVNKDVEHRTDFMSGGVIMGGMNILLIVCLALIQEMSVFQKGFIRLAGIAFANGFINSILVLGMMPLYENVFGITTKFKLLELSDLNADIFKEMIVNAPGTYNHCIVVSLLAEAASKAIGANHLLARVGGYYHDIGKLADASVYIENGVTDPRAKTLSPLEYAQLIISHVNKGVELAKKIELPEDVINFIREHHGTTTMTFFYHQALERAGTGDASHIKKSDFQYPGPKPNCKETAIVMLADSIEAAVRSMEKITYEKLVELVQKIIYNRLNDGELENSDLSMTELTVIRKIFLSLLKGIFHKRIEYPEVHNLRKLEKETARGSGAY